MKAALVVAAILLSFNTMGQFLTPDVDLVSEIVSARQEELKTLVLKNIVVKNIKTTNNTSFNTMHNLVQILVTEKNKTVMTKSIMREVASYSIAQALSGYFIKTQPAGAALARMPKNDLVLNSLILKGITTESRNLTDQIQQSVSTGSAGQSDRQSRLIGNFVIDKIYEELIKSKYMHDKGLFIPDPNAIRFNALPSNYYSEIALDTTALGPKIETFIKGLEQVAENADAIFAFIKNGNFEDFLKKQESIKYIFSLFNSSLDIFRTQLGQNSFLAKIGDIIFTYVIFDMTANDPEKIFSIKIDVEAIILAMEDKFFNQDISRGKIASLKKFWIGIEPFFDIGLNYAIAVDELPEGVTENADDDKYYQVAYVSEKFGLKFKFADWKYTRSQKPLEWFQYKGTYRRWPTPPSATIVNNVYGMIYASGIIYNVVDAKSKENFDFALVGAGVGVTFFNDLQLNVTYSAPFVDGAIHVKNGLVNLGFDIPIFQYLRELRKKK